MQGPKLLRLVEKLNLMSLQRRRELFTLSHMYKIHKGVAPNDVEINLYLNARLGVRVGLPKLKTEAKTRSMTLYDHSFAMNGP